MLLLNGTRTTELEGPEGRLLKNAHNFDAGAQHATAEVEVQPGCARAA